MHPQHLPIALARPQEPAPQPHLARCGYAGKVDARRGLIRGWDYHRGMVARITIAAEALTNLADPMFALGPIESVRLVTWDTGEVRKSSTFLPRLKVVSLAGTPANLPLPNLQSLKPLAAVPILDLRSVGIGIRPTNLLARAQSGALSPIVLYRGAMTVTRTEGRRSLQIQVPGGAIYVIDPHNKWDALRPEFADLMGEAISPIRYQGDTR